MSNLTATLSDPNDNFHVIAEPGGGVAHVPDLDLEAAGLQVFHPQLAAAAVGVFPNLHIRGLRHGGALKTGEGQHGSRGQPMTPRQGDG